MRRGVGGAVRVAAAAAWVGSDVVSAVSRTRARVGYPVRAYCGGGGAHVLRAEQYARAAAERSPR
jgi:hypothetical protein